MQGKPVPGGGIHSLRREQKYPPPLQLVVWKGGSNQQSHHIIGIDNKMPVPVSSPVLRASYGPAIVLFFPGQCEFSFAKTALVMEMNKKEMDRYDTIYR